MKHLVFLLEEPSARDLLEGVLPRILPEDISVQYLVFEGKQDLEKNVVRRMKHWLAPDTSFVVMRDQDAGDCLQVKARLAELVRQTGRTSTLIRIVCRSLESWIVGDWHAVAKAFERPGLAGQGVKEAHRDPDQLARPIDALRAHLPEYQKRDGARRVAPHMDLSRNQSRSFQTFVFGVQKLVRGSGA